MNFRPERVSKLIREQLSELIERELEFPETLVTVTEVEVGKKLEGAKVLVSVWPTTSASLALRTLEGARRALQSKLKHQLNIKPMPEIFFQLDTGPENAAQVEKAVLESEREENS